MAKPSGPASDDIMTPAAMKPILALSKQEPVSAAIAITADGEGVILLHKKAKPKKVFAMLRNDATKAKIQLNNASVRFGRAEVDPDYDPGMVRFFINKDAPGNMRVKLLEVVKRVPYQKVEINVDPSLDAEPEDEVQSEEVSATAAPGQPGATGAPPAPPPPPQMDLSALHAELAALIPQIGKAAADANKLAALKKLAVDGTEAIKEGHADAAAAAIQQLRAALAQPVAHSGTGQPQQNTGVVAYAKSRLAWLATRKRLESDIHQLESEIVATYEDEEAGQELAGAYTAWIGPVLSALDERLADALDAAVNAADAAQRAKLVADAKTLIVEYTTFLNSDPRIAELDDNPFLPLAIRSTVGGTLSALAKAIV